MATCHDKKEATLYICHGHGPHGLATMNLSNDTMNCQLYQLSQALISLTQPIE